MKQNWRDQTMEDLLDMLRSIYFALKTWEGVKEL